MVSMVIQSVSKSVSKLVCEFKDRGARASFAPPGGLGRSREGNVVAKAGPKLLISVPFCSILFHLTQKVCGVPAPMCAQRTEGTPSRRAGLMDYSVHGFMMQEPHYLFSGSGGEAEGAGEEVDGGSLLQPQRHNVH
jgi:hypothetical protein